MAGRPSQVSIWRLAEWRLAEDRLDILRGAQCAPRMIQSFKSKDTLALYEGKSPRRFKALAKVAARKLSPLDAAQTLAFLKAPPENHLEALKDDRKGQHPILSD